MLRHRGGDGDRRLVFRNRYCHLTRMKMQGRTACARRAAIDIVADDWPSHLGAVHAQLMGASGQGLERKPAETGAATHYLPRTRRWQAVRVGFHPPAARLVASRQRNVDAPFVRFGAIIDNRPIAFADLALLEQLTEQSECLAVTTEHKAAGRVTIEPMRQRRRTRQSEPQCIEIVLEGIAALRAAMDRQPGRFVDHQHQPVTVQKAGEHLFRCHAETAITCAA